MGDCTIVTAVSFLKYQALGNDFLVALDPSALPGDEEVDTDFVIAVCDRHRGVGADGLLVARPVGAAGEGSNADVRLELRNADGGRAETSGNGICCLALAVLDAGMVAGPDVLIRTDAGPRLVSLVERSGRGVAVMRAEMGTVEVSPSQAVGLAGPGSRARYADAGNPHLVLVASSLEGVDIVGLGRELEGGRPGGQNVEVIAPDGAGGLDLLVWERGAGLTQACGTGSCAAAAVARELGLVGDRVEVHNPGGTLVVDLSGDALAPSVWLSSPVSRVMRAELLMSEIDVLA